METNKKISKTLDFIQSQPRTENEIKDFISTLSFSEYGIEKIFTALHKYDLITYDDNQKIQLRYILWYFPPKTLFVPNQRELKAITRVRKMTGTKSECEKKRSELLTKLNTSLDRFIIE